MNPYNEEGRLTKEAEARFIKSSELLGKAVLEISSYDKQYILEFLAAFLFSFAIGKDRYEKMTSPRINDAVADILETVENRSN